MYVVLHCDDALLMQVAGQAVGDVPEHRLLPRRAATPRSPRASHLQVKVVGRSVFNEPNHPVKSAPSPSPRDQIIERRRAAH